ncbi:MAG: ABC transporter permease, partial [Phycisphaerae bacterium]|nr:ABC transporter permease [Phycisphaerae bacterium]
MLKGVYARPRHRAGPDEERRKPCRGSLDAAHQPADASRMGLLEQLLAIARNTFLESIRQPVALVVTVVAGLLVVMANPFSAYTMMDDDRMFLDMSLSTVFLSGALLAAMLATNVVSREIENRTALTVISKPVARASVVLGKYLGAVAALLACMLALMLVLALVELHGVQQTVRTPYHLPVISFGSAAVLLAFGVATWCNYFYASSFAAVFIMSVSPLLLVAYVLALLFDTGFAPQSIATDFRPEVWKAGLLMALGVAVLCAVAVAVSTRLGQVLTVAVTVGTLLIG